MTFGATLAHYREMRNASQGDVARWSGLDRSYISRLESGEREANADVAVVIASALRLPPIHRARLVASALGWAHEDWPEELVTLLVHVANHEYPRERVRGMLQYVLKVLEDA